MVFVYTQYTLFCMWLSGMFTEMFAKESRPRRGLRRAISTVVKNERAIEMVEFAVMTAVIAIVAIALANLYGIIRTKFTQVGVWLNQYSY